MTLQLNEDIPEPENTASEALYMRILNCDIMQPFLLGVPKDTLRFLMESEGLRTAATAVGVVMLILMVLLVQFCRALQV